MGNEQSPKAPPPDMGTVIMKMKMAAKRFKRESDKSEKEAQKNMTNAKAQLVKGNEEGARLYAANAQNNKNESKKYLSMSVKLDAMTGSLKSNHNFQQLMNGISKDVVPMMMSNADSMDLK